MFYDWLYVGKFWPVAQVPQVANIRLCQWAGEMGIFFESGNIHQVRVDLMPDISSHLREDVESAIIHVRPEINGSCFRDEPQQAADGWGWVAHEADDCVFRFTCFVSADELMEGCQVFDAEDRVWRG